jgi:hypothetical protein
MFRAVGFLQSWRETKVHPWKEVPIVLASREQGLRLLCSNWFL